MNPYNYEFANLREKKDGKYVSTISAHVLSIVERYRADSNVKADAYDKAYDKLCKRNKLKNKVTERGHHVPYTLLARYFEFVYLTGCSLMDPVRSPNLCVELISEENLYRVKIERTHKTNKGKPDVFMQELTINDTAEQKMWQTIMGGQEKAYGATIFKFDAIDIETKKPVWRSKTEQNMHCLFKTNFKTFLRPKGGHKINEEMGISPNVLRRMRIYSFIRDYNVPYMRTIEWLGWENNERGMREVIRMYKEFAIGNKFEALKREGLLTGLDTRTTAPG